MYLDIYIYNAIHQQPTRPYAEVLHRYGYADPTQQAKYYAADFRESRLYVALLVEKNTAHLIYSKKEPHKKKKNTHTHTHTTTIKYEKTYHINITQKKIKFNKGIHEDRSYHHRFVQSKDSFLVAPVRLGWKFASLSTLDAGGRLREECHLIKGSNIDSLPI